MHMCMHMHMCMCMCMCAQVAPWAGQASITTGLPFTEGEGYSKGDTPGMGKALELGSTQVRLAQGWVPLSSPPEFHLRAQRLWRRYNLR